MNIWEVIRSKGYGDLVEIKEFVDHLIKEKESEPTVNLWRVGTSDKTIGVVCDEDYLLAVKFLAHYAEMDDSIYKSDLEVNRIRRRQSEVARAIESSDDDLKKWLSTNRGSV